VKSAAARRLLLRVPHHRERRKNIAWSAKLREKKEKEK
jgi:hypothetical protein